MAMNKFALDFHRTLQDRYAVDRHDMSISDWIVENTYLKHKNFSFYNHEFQIAIADDLHPNMDVIKCSQVGLALALDTPVPTKHGWTTMGDIQVGEVIFDEQGDECVVTYVSPVYHNRQCYEILFSDGHTIVADAEHRWYVESDIGQVLTTKEIHRELVKQETSPYYFLKNSFLYKKPKFFINTTAPINGTKKYISIGSYNLGVWLASQSFPTIDADITSMLRASVEQRKAILGGILDIGGWVDPSGQVWFKSKSKPLVNYVEELIASLGFTYKTRWVPLAKTTLKRPDVDISEEAIINFVCHKEDKIFRLEKNRGNLKFYEHTNYSNGNRHYILSITPVSSVPVRCLTVDSPSHLFLVGRGMIPTHNTEIQLRKILAFLNRNTATAIFTLPNDEMYKRVSKGRLMPIIEQSPIFTPPGSKPIRSMGMMQFNQSYLYVTGAKESDATSISADAVFNDEVDLTDQENLSLFNSRLQHSEWKLRQRFSTPSYSGYGIDLSYGSSDQHEYMCRCEHCNHWNIPDFDFKHIIIPGMKDNLEDWSELDDSAVEAMDLYQAQVVCEKCKKPLNLKNPELREWVPRFAARTHARGYRVRPFSVGYITIEYIVQQLLDYKRRDNIKGWYNTVLGQAHSGGSGRLSHNEIRANLINPESLELKRTDHLWLGIDVGQTCYITVGRGVNGVDEVVNIFEIQAANLIQFLKKFTEQYQVIGGAIDRYPYTPLADTIYDMTNGVIVPVEYSGKRPINAAKNAVGSVTHVQVNRTQAIDAVVNRIRSRSLPINGYSHKETVIIEHLRDMVREEEPEKQPVWVKLNGNDHYFHSLTYLLLAPEIAGTLHELSGAEIRSMYGTFAMPWHQQEINILDRKGRQSSLLYGQEQNFFQSGLFR